MGAQVRVLLRPPEKASNFPFGAACRKSPPAPVFSAGHVSPVCDAAGETRLDSDFIWRDGPSKPLRMGFPTVCAPGAWGTRRVSLSEKGTTLFPSVDGALVVELFDHGHGLLKGDGAQVVALAVADGHGAVFRLAVAKDEHVGNLHHLLSLIHI